MLSNDSVDDLVDPSAIMMVGDLPSDNSNLMADLDDNGSLLGTGAGGSPMEFFGSLNTPLISPTTTASVITSGRSVVSGGGGGGAVGNGGGGGGSTTASYYHQGTDLNPS